MRLVRYGAVGAEKLGVVDARGQIRAVPESYGDLTALRLSPRGLKELASLEIDFLPRVKGETRFGPPCRNVGKFIAVGLNYSDHAAESGMPVPSEPVLFMKATSCIVGPNDQVMLPRGSLKADWEVELGVVMGRQARYVTEADALDYVAGYCVVNDVSERAYQLERGGTWDKGKGCDTFGPVGPYLVTADEVGDPQTLDLWLDVNGVRRQSGNTRTMIFTVRTLVSYISQFMTLNAGDLITTGTPPGVGMGQKPTPIYLKAGDVVTLGISKLGSQRQEVISYRNEWDKCTDKEQA
jgi:2,4-diketo-3-deoxy-L-fuconate hydrolase